MVKKLNDIIENLITRDYEEEWFEFKINWFEPHELGTYISGMSNVAAMVGQEYAYLIWGVENELHKIECTSQRQECTSRCTSQRQECTSRCTSQEPKCTSQYKKYPGCGQKYPR